MAKSPDNIKWLALQPKQMDIGKLFYKTGPDAATWIGGGGARAGGKSGGLRRIMLDRRQQRPGTAGCIIRRVWEELRINHVEKYFTECPDLRQFWEEGKHRFKLPNGSTINFMYAENQQEVDRKFWGPEFYDIMVDQAEQFSEQELTTIKTANRAGHTALGECKMGLFFNPGGVGTEFLRRVFAQKRFNANERSSDFAFVHLFGWDNFVWFDGTELDAQQFYALPGLCKSAEGDAASGYMCCRFHLFIMRTTEGRKLNALPASLRAGHLLGSFDSFAGQYFAGVWDESKLILTSEQENSLIQSWWPRWMAQDAGFVHHAAVGWFASGRVNPKAFKDIFGVEIKEAVECAVLYRTWAAQEVEEGELVRKCAGQMGPDERKMTRRYFLSADAWEQDSHGHSVAETIAEESRRLGLPYPEQPDNGRIGGWRFMYAMMKKTADVLGGKMNPTRTAEDYDDEAGGYSIKTPLLFISPDCLDAIEAIPMLVRDDKHPGKAEDVLKMPTKADDVGDMVRYGLKSMLSPRSQAPVEVRAREYYESLKSDCKTSKAIAMQAWELKNKPGRKSAWASRQ